MAAGHPLTDEDRWPWLDTIAAWIDERVAAGEPAVVTCSALKKIYRDKLRRQGVVFVYMQGTFDEVMERLSHRQGHFMKPACCNPSPTFSKSRAMTKFTSTYTSARPIPNTRPWPWPVPSACEPSLGSP